MLSSALSSTDNQIATVNNSNQVDKYSKSSRYPLFFYNSQSFILLSQRDKETDNRREAPPPNRTLGVFGVSTYTKQVDLEDIFKRYGTVEKIIMVFDNYVSHPLSLLYESAIFNF